MILERVRQIIAEHLCIDMQKVQAESDIKDLGADSLDIVEMLMTAEEEWGIVIDDDTIGNFSTVKSVADYIEKNVK